MIRRLRISKFSAPDEPEPEPTFVEAFADEPQSDIEGTPEENTMKRKWHQKVKRKRKRIGSSYNPDKRRSAPAVHEIFRLNTSDNMRWVTVGRRIIREGEHSEEDVQQVMEHEEQQERETREWEREHDTKWAPNIPVEADGSKDPGRYHRYLGDAPIETSGWEGDMPDPDHLPSPPRYDPDRERLEKERLKRDQNFWDWYESKGTADPIEGMPDVVIRAKEEKKRSKDLIKFMEDDPTAFGRVFDPNPYRDPQTKEIIQHLRDEMLEEVRQHQENMDIQKEVSIWPSGQHGRPFYPKDGPDHYAFSKVKKIPSPLDQIVLVRRWAELPADYKRRKIPDEGEDEDDDDDEDEIEYEYEYDKKALDELEMSMVMAGYSDRQAHYQGNWELEAMEVQLTDSNIMWKVLAWSEQRINRTTNMLRHHTHLLQPFAASSENIDGEDVWRGEWELVKCWSVAPLLNHSLFPVMVRIQQPQKQRIKKPMSLVEVEEQPVVVDQITQTEWLPQLETRPEPRIMLEQPTVNGYSIAGLKEEALQRPIEYFFKYPNQCILYAINRPRQDIDNLVTGHAFIIEHDEEELSFQVAPWLVSLRVHITIQNNRRNIDFLIDRIINTEDDNCQVRGLYAGGPIGQSRLTQDVSKDPRRVRQERIGYLWQPPGASQDPRYSRWERTGLFLGNGSLLAVRDDGEMGGFGSLLKEQTFLIYHGDLAIAMNYKTNLTWACRQVADQYKLCALPYPPNVMILPEGVHVITIERQEWADAEMSYRSAFLYRRDSADNLMFTFQWLELMVDFNYYPDLGQEHVIIEMDRIPDYRYFDHPMFPNYLLFGMYAAPECRPVLLVEAHPNDLVISEYYNVWLPLLGTNQCASFGSIRVDYYFRVLNPNSRANPSDEVYRDAEVGLVWRTFPNTLTHEQMQNIYGDNLHYFIRYHNRFNETTSLEPMRNALLQLITRRDGENIVHQTVNPGQYTRRAEQLYPRNMPTGVPPLTNTLEDLRDRVLELMDTYMDELHYIRGPDDNLREHQFSLLQDYQDYIGQGREEQEQQKPYRHMLRWFQARQQTYGAQVEQQRQRLSCLSLQEPQEQMDYQQQGRMTKRQRKIARQRKKRKDKRLAKQQAQLNLQGAQATQQQDEPEEEWQDMSEESMEEQMDYQQQPEEQMTWKQKKAKEREQRVAQRQAKRQARQQGQQHHVANPNMRRPPSFSPPGSSNYGPSTSGHSRKGR